jgi:hypothetical protein
MVSALFPCSVLSASKNIFVALLCFSLLFPFFTVKATGDTPATEWDRTYGAISGIAAFSVDDGGYAIAGTTGDWLMASRGGGSWTNETRMLIKIDAAGEVQWTRNYTRGMARSAVLTSDGGYALSGKDSLTKIDSQGNAEWSKTYTAFADMHTDRSDAFVSSVIQTSDGGYAIVGYGDHPISGTEGRLVKTDSNGNVQWNKTYGELNEVSYFLSVAATDNGFALAGSSQGDMWLVKIDSNGNVQWEEMYGGENMEECRSVVSTSDGGYLLSGYTASFGVGDEDCWAVKTDSHGNVQWERTYGTSGRDRFTSAVQARNGGYVLVGITDMLRDFAGVAIKLSASGELEWERSFSGDNKPESVTVASDGGYIFAGYKGDSTNRDSMVWAVKIAPDSGVQETTPPPSEPSPSPSEPPELFYATWIVIAAVIAVTGLGLGLLIYLTKRNR